MLTNQDRRAILEQVKASDSGDIIAALRGQVSTEPMQNPAPTQEPVNIPQSPQPIDVDLETTSTLPSNSETRSLRAWSALSTLDWNPS